VFVSAKLNKSIPNKLQLITLKQGYTSSPRDEVFGMLLFFMNHFGDCEDMKILQKDLMRSDEQVQALAASKNFSELVHNFNSLHTGATLTENLLLWLVEGARSVSR